MTSDFFENEKINDAEKQISYGQAFSKLLPFLKDHSKGLWGCLLLLAGTTVLSLSWPILLKRALDVDLANSDYSGLLWTVALIGLVQIFTVIFQYFMRIKPNNIPPR